MTSFLPFEETNLIYFKMNTRGQDKSPDGVKTRTITGVARRYYYHNVILRQQQMPIFQK